MVADASRVLRAGPHNWPVLYFCAPKPRGAECNAASNNADACRHGGVWYFPAPTTVTCARTRLPTGPYFGISIPFGVTRRSMAFQGRAVLWMDQAPRLPAVCCSLTRGTQRAVECPATCCSRFLLMASELGSSSWFSLDSVIYGNAGFYIGYRFGHFPLVYILYRQIEARNQKQRNSGRK